MTREEHLTWAQTRALEYCRLGEAGNALASIVSDLTKHEETAALAEGGVDVMAAILVAPGRKLELVREWIEGLA